MDDELIIAEVVTEPVTDGEGGDPVVFPEGFTPKPGYEYVMHNGTLAAKAKNGALYDPIHGGWLSSKGNVKKFTHETSLAAHRARAERKRQVVIAAANEAVENRKWKTEHRDMAYVAALANAAMIKATTPEDPKAIEAARFVMMQSGLMDEDEKEKGKNESLLTALGREAVEQILARAKAEREEG